MVSFSSSAVNKSGKRFAPKPPARRTAPAPAYAGKPATAQQATDETNQSAGLAAASTLESAAAVAARSEGIDSGNAAAAVESSSSADHVVSPDLETASPAGSAVHKSIAFSHYVPTPIAIPQSRRRFSASDTRSKTASAPVQQPFSPVTAERDAENLDTVDSHLNELTSQAAAEADFGNFPDRPGRSSQSSQSLPAAPELMQYETRPAKRLKTSSTANITEQVNQGPPEAAVLSVSHPGATEGPNPIESTEETETETRGPVAPSTVKSKSKRRKKELATTSGTDSNGVIAEQTARRRRRSRKARESTPDDAELVEIAPAVVKMSELCKDLRTGRKSRRETELRSMEQAEHDRRLKAQEETGASGGVSGDSNEGRSGSASREALGDRLAQPQAAAGPVMRIVNGEIVLDAASLQVDRHADAARFAGDLEDVVESSLTRKINQATYGKRSKTESWDEEMTDLFYRGLRMFGTDFMMISKMFPGRSRRQIKLKFNNEERRDPDRIKRTLLGPSETVDIATYSEMTNTVYDDPRMIQQELDEEKKRIEEQHAKEKEAQEELMRNPDGAIGGLSNASASENAPSSINTPSAERNT